MLQGSAHLQFEANLVELGHFRIGIERFGQAADVVERIVAKAVEIVHTAFVDGVGPVYFEEYLSH